MNKKNYVGDVNMMVTHKRIMAGVLSLIIAMSLFGCGNKEKSGDNTYDAEFMGVQWIREVDEDMEFLSFMTDGTFSYYCSCGNPVNDSDLIQSYSYDEDNQTITFNAAETTDSMVTKIKVLEFDKEHLKLDFDGDIREFRIESKS